MLFNLTRVNKSLWFVFIQFWACTDAYGQVFQLSNDDIDWLGERIFINECAARFDCITSWNEGEEFPSLGIGHFIWYQAEQKGPFEETFPALVDFMASRHAEIPKWLLHTKNVNSPWESRAEFYDDFGWFGTLEELEPLYGYTINATQDFIQHPAVANGASDILVALLGENGKHARVAAGMGSLPAGVPVEIDLIVELK